MTWLLMVAAFWVSTVLAFALPYNPVTATVSALLLAACMYRLGVIHGKYDRRDRT